MAHWNYRVVRYYDGTHGICEVHYKSDDDSQLYKSDDDSQLSFTTEPVGAISESIEGLGAVLDMMRIALSKPVLVLDKNGAFPLMDKI